MKRSFCSLGNCLGGRRRTGGDEGKSGGMEEESQEKRFDYKLFTVSLDAFQYFWITRY